VWARFGVRRRRSTWQTRRPHQNRALSHPTPAPASRRPRRPSPAIIRRRMKAGPRPSRSGAAFGAHCRLLQGLPVRCGNLWVSIQLGVGAE